MSLRASEIHRRCHAMQCDATLCRWNSKNDTSITQQYALNRPSRQADSSPVSKVFSGSLMEPERSLPCAQHPATLPHSKPDESSLCLPTVSLTYEPSYLFSHLLLIHQTVRPASPAILRQWIVQTRSSNTKCLTQYCNTTEFRLDFFQWEGKLSWVVSSWIWKIKWAGGDTVTSYELRDRGKLRETGKPVSR